MLTNKRKKKSLHLTLHKSRSMSLNFLKRPSLLTKRNKIITRNPQKKINLITTNKSPSRPSFQNFKKPIPLNQSFKSTLTVTRERSPSLSSNFSARSRSRSISPLFPSSHFRKSKNPHRALNLSIVWDEYKINSEITNLAAQFLNSGRKLPPINIPLNLQNDTSWPKNIPLYFISIKPERQQAFLQRYKGPNAVYWPGTNGRTSDIAKLNREGRLNDSNLKRGEIGCYLSHYRLWEKIVSDQIPMTIICEDDVNLTGSVAQAQYLNQLLSEVQHVPFDILFLSWFRYDGGQYNTSHTRNQWTFCQLWSYIITLNGAKKLITDSNVRKMSEPVDVAIFSTSCQKNIKTLVAYPPLCLTIGSYSDTCNIR